MSSLNKMKQPIKEIYKKVLPIAITTLLSLFSNQALAITETANNETNNFGNINAIFIGNENNKIFIQKDGERCTKLLKDVLNINVINLNSVKESLKCINTVYNSYDYSSEENDIDKLLEIIKEKAVKHYKNNENNDHFLIPGVIKAFKTQDLTNLDLLIIEFIRDNLNNKINNLGNKNAVFIGDEEYQTFIQENREKCKAALTNIFGERFSKGNNIEDSLTCVKAVLSSYNYSFKVNDKTMDDKTMNDKTMDDKTMNDKTMDDETMDDETMNDKTMDEVFKYILLNAQKYHMTPDSYKPNWEDRYSKEVLLPAAIRPFDEMPLTNSDLAMLSLVKENLIKFFKDISFKK